ncbi:MAG: hypothetical protein KKC37_12930 [Proteobacteria bacterium]|nr:hypothetical protein [Pseudomonadota bacterium]
MSDKGVALSAAARGVNTFSIMDQAGHQRTDTLKKYSAWATSSATTPPPRSGYDETSTMLNGRGG